MRIVKHCVPVCLVLSLAICAAAQQLPPVYDTATVQPVESRTIAELPRNTFLENIVIASDGTAFITSHLDGRILRMAPNGVPQPWAQIDGKATGIAERKDGSFLVSGWTKDDKAALFQLDTAGRSSLLVLLKGGMFPNGVAPWKDDQFFLADSYRGAIYLVNGMTGKHSVWLEDDRLRRADVSSPTPGVNGLKVFGGSLYASNTARQQLLRIAIDRGAKPGLISLVSSSNNLDDFSIDATGNLYGTTHVYNKVVRVAPDGTTTVIAGEEDGVTGCTALAFGRRPTDRHRLYVVTNGGMSLPPPGGVETAKIVELDLTKVLSSQQARSKGQNMKTSITPLQITSSSDRVAVLKTGSGPAVVIIHGIGGHKEDWQGVMGVLADRHTVYAIDMIGFGGSSKDAPEIPIARQADAVEALLDSEHIDKASLIGNSVGGWVAATFASTRPHRVDKLVLVDVGGFKAMFESPSPVNFYPESVADMQKLLSLVTSDSSKHTAEFAATALDALNQSGDRAAGEAVFKGLFPSPRLEEVMPAIKAPTLVVWGAQDKLFPPVIADLVNGGIAGSRKVLIEGAGHFSQLDNPVEFHRVVTGFLNETSPR
ncbi:MAG: alpha/beta fold hydrolase [Bryobacteraceae bacterium]|nr:alpha/beta fold hydrolase [Bryobacteraceae bacterium]